MRALINGRHKARFMVNINSVVAPTPLAELVEVFEFARRHRFSTTVQIVHDAGGQILLQEKDRRAYCQVVQKFLNPVWNLTWGQTRDLILMGSAPFKCRAGSRYVYINEFGNVCWCSATQESFHKSLEHYTREDLKAQFYRKKGCEEHCMLGCVRSSRGLEEFRRYGIPQGSLAPARSG
jgi:hypothetical protein